MIIIPSLFLGVLIIICAAFLFSDRQKLDCKAYSIRMYEVWGYDLEKTESECNSSHVRGPYRLDKAKSIRYNHELKGFCRLPGPYLMPDYSTAQSRRLIDPDNWYVFCPN